MTIGVASAASAEWSRLMPIFKEEQIITTEHGVAPVCVLVSGAVVLWPSRLFFDD